KQIRTIKTPPRRRTVANLEKAKTAITETCGFRPTDEQIWRDLSNKSLSRNVRNFLWKAMHMAHKVGDYFSNMPEPWKSYSTCRTCGTVETLEHILLACPDSNQAQVWALVADTLYEMGASFAPDFGLILGCASIKAGDGEPKDAGTTRAMRIIISESAFLIWKMRCEKRIEHEEDPDWEIPPEQVDARWSKAIAVRVDQDRRLTNKTKFNHSYLSNKVVSDTW
ncbi:hypothetical protein AURDEDRAFT_22494, partial [Auricularia subglabra TFB-10046 SS5]